MVVAMMTADVGFPDRPRRQYTATDIARHQDILMAASYILNTCVRGKGQSGWVSTGVWFLVPAFGFLCLASPIFKLS